jgi:benzoylformate decarboxylase
VGIALAERDSGRNRPVIAIIGDGSFQYSVQSLWTAAQLNLGVPGLDIPALTLFSIAKGYGCDVERLDDLDAIKKAAVAARSKSKPTVLEIPISAQVPPLI